MAALSTTLLVGATVAAGGYQAYQQHQAGKAARRQGDYEGQILDLNAANADALAKDAVARGTEDERRFRTGVKGLIGSQRAALAASGVDIGDGSALDVQADAAYLGELDAQQIRMNARREALGYETQGANLRQQAELARRGGRNQQQAANQAAVGTLLTTGVSAYGAYGQYRSGGAGPRVNGKYGGK